MTQTGLQAFHFGPFRFDSEIEIAQLQDSSDSGLIVVTVRLGRVPEILAEAETLGDVCQVTPTEVLFNIPGVAKFHVMEGREVRIEILPGVSLSDVCTYLLGSVFGVLCHQNGLLPLHASSVAHDGKVTAFLGDSGAGKSTLAACLLRRRHVIVSDDICLIQPESPTMEVTPLAVWLKLWSQSLDHLGESADANNRVVSDEEKYRVPLSKLETGPLSLSRVIFLARSTDPTAQPTLRLLDTASAVAKLIDMTYVGWIPEMAGQQANLFRRCARVIQHVEAMELTAPWGLDRMESVLDLIEGNLLDAVG